jgi:hypothetical protein
LDFSHAALLSTQFARKLMAIGANCEQDKSDIVRE